MRSEMLVFMIYIIPPLGAYDMDSIQMLVAFGARYLHFRGPSLDDQCIGRGTSHVCASGEESDLFPFNDPTLPLCLEPKYSSGLTFRFSAAMSL
ncbi:uncharacterized protein BT62DRAFT_262138 [Guyanagaster necrorhizus]|uniref:Uncharacterized protein n=1 Tax=Guyanagaster necrorhizus TaxID=856835 RepID=A0A9P7W3W9_9AGAR|nr:uncharacterized protein BT62DRAFT_262138 [Guyanagaster necrorhizus MCA 3950]KAG7451707.1 hypothetical protein BT62DRAFT_262138 [Guyanagaster necrorhizus MCA 3950]